MATARLVAASYTQSSTSYTSITSASNMYNNTDNTTYATLQHTRNNNSTAYYLYLHNFDFSSIPSGANVSSFTVKLKARASGQATGSSYRMSLYYKNGSSWTSISNTTCSSDIANSNTATTYTIPVGNLTWSTMSGYGNNFAIRIPIRRSSSRTAAYIYIYGAEIEVTYTAEAVHPTSVSVSPSTASIGAGDTVQLTETVLPSNATDKSVTWSSNNTSVATVSSSGLVTGVSAGSATITVTTVDGSKTATCAVTVTPAVTYTYKLATSMEVGKKYLIANGNSGSVYLLTDESGGSRQLVGQTATVSNNRITITGAVKSKAEFECVRYTSGNDNTITVEIDNKYLYTDNSTGLRTNAPTTLDRFWHYRDNKFWQFKSTTSDGYSDTSSEYKYYLELNSSNNYTDNHVSTTSIEDSTIPAIYIFVEDDGSGDEPKFYVKNNGTWTQVSKIYKKVNGSWVEQASSTWSTLFSTSTNYRKMT